MSNINPQRKPLNFKNLNNTQQAPARAAGSSFTGKTFALVKAGFPVHKWVAGRNLLRLVPDRNNKWFRQLYFISFGKSQTARGYLRIENPGFDGELFKIRKMLRENDLFSQYLYNKDTNPNGVNLTAKPKLGFLAFDIKDPAKTIKAVTLPDTIPWERKDGQARRIAAGTRLVGFTEELNVHNKPKWGPIADLVDGRAIIVDVANPGNMQAQYEPSVDEAYPLAVREKGEVYPLPEFEGLLSSDTYPESIDDVYPVPAPESLQEAMKAVLPFEAYEYVATSLGWGSTEKTTSEPTAPVAKAAQYPIPEDDDAPLEPTQAEIDTFLALKAKMQGAGLKQAK